MNDPSDLTHNALREARERFEELRTPLYYGTERAVPRGQVLHFRLQPGLPEWYLFHPDDLEPTMRALPMRRFIHLRDYLPTNQDIEQVFHVLRADVNKRRFS